MPNIPNEWPPRTAKGYDLDRLKWLDVDSADRFIKKEPRVPPSASNEDRIENILMLLDNIFSHLSVFERFSETTSRGAQPFGNQDLNPSDNASVTNALQKAEHELFKASKVLNRHQQKYMRDAARQFLDASGREGIRLHVGCGSHLIEGWVNIDAGGGDFPLNILWGLPFKDNTVDYIYCAHTIEHLRFQDQSPYVLREFHRVLSPGGVVRLVVPNTFRLLEAYVKRDRIYFSNRERYYPLVESFKDHGIATLDYILLFCGAGNQLLNFNHKFCYDSFSLHKLLASAGFQEIAESDYQNSCHESLRIDDRGENAIAKQDESGKHFSIFVEAIKH